MVARLAASTLPGELLFVVMAKVCDQGHPSVLPLRGEPLADHCGETQPRPSSCVVVACCHLRLRGSEELRRSVPDKLRLLGRCVRVEGARRCNGCGQEFLRGWSPPGREPRAVSRSVRRRTLSASPRAGATGATRRCGPRASRLSQGEVRSMRSNAWDCVTTRVAGRLARGARRCSATASRFCVGCAICAEGWPWT